MSKFKISFVRNGFPNRMVMVITSTRFLRKDFFGEVLVWKKVAIILCDVGDAAG